MREQKARKRLRDAGLYVRPLSDDDRIVGGSSDTQDAFVIEPQPDWRYTVRFERLVTTDLELDAAVTHVLKLLV